MRILITEAANAPLDGLAGLDVVEHDGLWCDRDALLAAVTGADGLVVRNSTRVDAELIEAAARLRVVGRLGAGLDNLDLEALRRKRIAVVHGGGLNAQAVAEYVIGACFNLARGLAWSDRDVRAAGWRRHVGVELAGQRLGIVGLGATGAQTARLGRAVGFVVAGFDPHVEPPPGVHPMSIDDLLDRSRFLSIHVPLTETTRGLIGHRELARLPDRSFLVNAARGGIVDEQALAEALQSGHLAGAALDVRVTEPPPLGDPLTRLENVLLTAHLAGLTEESQGAIAAHVLSGVRRALSR